MDYVSTFLANNPEILTIYYVIRGVAIFLIVVLIPVTFYALYQLWQYRPKFVYDPRKWQKYVKPKKGGSSVKTPVIANAWGKVQSRLKDGSANSLRLAIIEADGVVDNALRRLGLSGETFADRLGHLDPEKYSTLDRLWDAHRIRNNLVHTPDFQVPTAKAEEAIAAYEAFLKEIKAL